MLWGEGNLSYYYGEGWPDHVMDLPPMLCILEAIELQAEIEYALFVLRR